MKRLYLAAMVLSIVSFCGCAGLWSKKTTAEPRNTFVQSGKIFQKDRLLKGGKLLIVPFSAGENVAANERLDRISLKIVKGISDILRDNNIPLEVLVAQNASEAEFVLSGHVVRLRERDGFIRRILNKEKRSLSVEGKIVDIKTDQVISQFSHLRSSKNRNDSLENLGLIAGQDIGRFISSVFR